MISAVLHEDSYDYNSIMRAIEAEAKLRKIKLTAKRIKAFRMFLTEVNPEAKPVVDSNGIMEPDKNLSDTEKVPLKYPGGVNEYFKNEIKPYSQDAWIDEDSIGIGYEISFTEEFYVPTSLRKLDEIVADIIATEKTTDGLIKSIFGGIGDEQKI